MSHHQYKLFEYTRTSELLIGDDVVKIDKVKRIIKSLQKQKIMLENWRLDISCRDPSIISDVIIINIDPSSAAASYGKCAIAVVVTPMCISPYTPPVAYFHKREDAEAMLDTVQAYLTYKYGI